MFLKLFCTVKILKKITLAYFIRGKTVGVDLGKFTFFARKKKPNTTHLSNSLNFFSMLPLTCYMAQKMRQDQYFSMN